MKISRLVWIALLSGLFGLTACGGGSSGGGSAGGSTAFTLGGTVSGLTGTGLVLQNNGSDDKAIAANGPYTFDTALDDGASYAVTVATQPSGQTCTVTNADTGTISGVDITDVTVACIDNGGPDTTAPQVLSAPDTLPLGDYQDIVIVFDESMDTLSWALNGTLPRSLVGIKWSNTNITDDTLTLNSGWFLGEGQTLSVDADDLAGNPTATLNLTFNVYAGTVYFVSSTAADDSGDGLSPATAKQTIQAAIDAATDPASVVVNAGTYNVDSGAGTHVIMKEGVSLIGGYNAGYTEYDRTTYITTITDTSRRVSGDVTNPNRAVEAGSGTGPETEIDGFTINGGGGDYSVAVLVNGGLTIQNNVIDGGSGDAQSYGIYSTSSSYIQNNTINGGSGVTDSLGIYNSRSASILQNAINGGSGGARTYGIYNDAATLADIYQNTIDGGAGSASSTGIHNTNISNSSISRNSITGGSGGTYSYGIRNDGNSSLYIHNNLIEGGSGDYTYGMYEENNAASTIQNNTISGGTGTTWAFGIGVIDTNSTVIENNILFTESGAAVTRCIIEWNADSDPAVVDNNDFFGCNVLYRDENYNNLTLTIINVTLGTGNVAFDPNFCTGFLCGGKWRFSGSTPEFLKTGGKNGTVLGWVFIYDKNGNSRPPTGGWSMGAYRCSPSLCPPVIGP